MGPLRGVRIIDLSRLAPGPYCTMLLADLGADVTTVGGGRAGTAVPAYSRGKRSITLDLKSEAGQRALHLLVADADVLVEGFRPGAADRMGAGYERLSAINPRLVYCSLTGYGQSGPRAQEAGHDINYLALTGVLGAIGEPDRPPSPPLNLVADFAGGSLFAALGIAAALLEREKTGKGQRIDAAMIDGCLSLMAMHFPAWGTPALPSRGKGLIGSPFYRCYECADGRYVAVGAVERAFFEELWTVLQLGDPPNHFDLTLWPAIETRLADAFASADRDHWAVKFFGTNACVTPVLAPDEAWNDEQIQWRHPAAGAGRVPPAPRFGDEPPAVRAAAAGDSSLEVLCSLGLDAREISEATGGEEPVARSGLDWPPRFGNAG